MGNTYETMFEKENGENYYHISISTTNFYCYKKLKDFIVNTVTQYEHEESVDDQIQVL